MRIYYKTSAVLVTDEVIEVGGRPTRRIMSLDSVHVVEVPSAPQWTGRRSGQAVVAALASFAVAVHDLMSGAGPLLLVPALTLGVAALAVVAGSRGAGTVAELWAVTSAGPVCLLRSRNKDTVAEIRRAVTAAREGRRA